MGVDDFVFTAMGGLVILLAAELVRCLREIRRELRDLERRVHEQPQTDKPRAKR